MTAFNPFERTQPVPLADPATAEPGEQVAKPAQVYQPVVNPSQENQPLDNRSNINPFMAATQRGQTIEQPVHQIATPAKRDSAAPVAQVAPPVPGTTGGMQAFTHKMVFDLARIQQTDTIRFGHYTRDGELFVYVDTLDRDMEDSVAKHLAYAYRFIVNMPTAGIENMGGPYLVTDNEDPPSLFPPIAGIPAVTARCLFRLNMGI